MKVTIYVCLTVTLLSLSACKRVVPPQHLRINVVVDPDTGIAPWLFSKTVHFNELAMRSSGGQQIEVATALKSDHMEFLETTKVSDKPEIVVIGLDFEKKQLKQSALDPSSELVLGDVPMVLLDVPHDSTPSSLGKTLNLAKARRISILQSDPIEHSAGLAALVLEAYGSHVLTSDGKALDKVRLHALLRWLPHRVKKFDPRKLDKLLNDEVAVITADQCGALPDREVLRARYPIEGTIEIKYRAYRLLGGNEEERDAAAKFLQYLALQHTDDGSGMPFTAKCAGPPPRVLPIPTESILNELLDSWKANNTEANEVRSSTETTTPEGQTSLEFVALQ